MSDDDSKPNQRRPWQPRYGLAGMLMLMLIFCIMAAAAYYLVRAVQGGTSFRTVSVIMITAAPALLVVLLSLLRAVFEWTRRSRRR
jgi:hypothetical protein